MMRRRLARALDWRFGALLARNEALSGRIEHLEASMHALAQQVSELSAALAETHRLVAALPQLAEDVRSTRDRLEERIEPMLRTVLAEESENRRRLHAARARPEYEVAYGDPHPLVSVLVATHERPHTLVERSLPSILAQTHGELEVLVVGDAAAPELGEAVRALGDPRISYTNLTQRTTAHPDPQRHWLVGSTMPRNEAAARARGSWLLNFDDDDELRPDAIESLLAFAREERVEVPYGGFEWHYPEGSGSEEIVFPPRAGSFGFQGALVHGALRFFERELVAAHLNSPGDMYLLERMLRAGVRFGRLDRIVWDYYPSTRWEDPAVRWRAAPS